MINDFPRYLNEAEVSMITGLALPTLRNWRFAKKGIPYTKLGRAIRYKADEVLSFMENHRVQINGVAGK